MRKVNNVYFDDSLYKEQICLHDITLLSGREHVLLLCSYPETEEFDDCLLTTDGPFRATLEGRHLHLSLPDIPKPLNCTLRISSKTGEFDETYHLHLYPSFSYKDRIGTYVNKGNKDQRITLMEDGNVKIETADLIDSLPQFRLHSKGMDSHSLALILPEGKYIDEEGTEFTLTPYVRFCPDKRALSVSLLLEAYKDGYCDKAYLCGEGDEDGIIGYDTFEWKEEK